MTTANGKTCLILGGRGFVGSAIVREAEKRGYATTVVEKDDYETHLGKSVDLLINANGNSRKYLAAQSPALEFDLSVRSVDRSLHDFKAGQYVHLSTIDVYPNHEDPARNRETALIDPKALSPYGFHKFMAEELVRYYAPRWLIFRMGGFVGPNLWKNSIYDLLKGRQLRVNPSSVYQYLHTDRLASLVFTVAEKNLSGETFNAVGDGVISLGEIAAMIPGAQTSHSQEPIERYEVSVEKLKSIAPVPRTSDTVRQFVEAVLSGREPIQ